MLLRLFSVCWLVVSIHCGVAPTTVATGFSFGQGITVKTATLYVADASASKVWKADVSGSSFPVTPTVYIGGTGNLIHTIDSPQQFAWNGNKLLFTDNSKWAVYSVDVTTNAFITVTGESGTYMAPYGNLNGMATVGTNVYYTDPGQGKLYKCVYGTGVSATSTTTMGSYGVQNGVYLAGFSVSGVDHLYIGDMGKYVVWEWVPSTSTITTKMGVASSQGCGAAAGTSSALTSIKLCNPGEMYVKADGSWFLADSTRIWYISGSPQTAVVLVGNDPYSGSDKHGTLTGALYISYDETNSVLYWGTSTTVYKLAQADLAVTCGAMSLKDTNGPSVSCAEAAVGGTCALSCSTGYSGTPSVTCQSDSHWSSVATPCTAIVCSAAPTVNGGTAVTAAACSNQFNYQSTCPITCPSGYTADFSTVTCTGTWDHSTVTCTANPCSALSTVGGAVASCTSGTTSGSQCTVTCPSGSTIDFASSLCTAGVWNHPTVTCTASATSGSSGSSSGSSSSTSSGSSGTSSGSSSGNSTNSTSASPVFTLWVAPAVSASSGSAGSAGSTATLTPPAVSSLPPATRQQLCSSCSSQALATGTIQVSSYACPSTFNAALVNTQCIIQQSYPKSVEQVAKEWNIVLVTGTALAVVRLDRVDVTSGGMITLPAVDFMVDLKISTCPSRIVVYHIKSDGTMKTIEQEGGWVQMQVTGGTCIVSVHCVGGTSFFQLVDTTQVSPVVAAVAPSSTVVTTTSTTTTAVSPSPSVVQASPSSSSSSSSSTAVAIGVGVGVGAGGALLLLLGLGLWFFLSRSKRRSRPERDYPNYPFDKAEIGELGFGGPYTPHTTPMRGA